MIKPKGEVNDISAFLGTNTKFSGTLIFDGLVRIDGDFEGNVKTKDSLVIANSGNVKAEVEAGVVKISGKFDGTIKAATKVELLKPAIVKGTITTPALSVEEGAIFDGQCIMSTKPTTNVTKEG